MKKSKIKDLAILYMRGKDRFPEISEEQRQRILDTNRRQYDLLLSGVDVIDSHHDEPYTSHEEMMTDFFDSGTLYISDNNHNSLLFNPEDNFKFRAVHDFYHCILDAPFTFDGEHKVFKKQKIAYHPDDVKVIYSEIVLQSAYYAHFNRFSPKQKIVW